MQDEDKRYYIEDEHIHDKREEIDPIYCETYNSAVKLCDFLNRQQEIIEEKLDKNHFQTTLEYWEEILDWLDLTERRITELEDYYEVESENILQKARETEFDFKAKYGANNRDVRKKYVDEILKDVVDEIKELKQYRTEDLRRRELLKFKCNGLLAGLL